MSRPSDSKSDVDELQRQQICSGKPLYPHYCPPELQRRLGELEEEIRRREQLERELQRKNALLENEIAGRQRAEEIAFVERDNTRTIFEAAPIGMMIINDSFRVIDANRALLAICGKGSAEILGRLPGEVFDCAKMILSSNVCWNAAECLVCDLREIARIAMHSRQARYGIEIKQLARKGDGAKNRCLKVSIEPITVSGQECAILAVEDISERRHMEEGMLRADKLESLGVLAGGIAHDFNNLLTGIMGNVSMALTKTSDDEVCNSLQRALQATGRATDLTRQLLTFAKGGTPVKQLVWIVDIVKDSAEFALRGANVSCEFNMAHDVWAAEVDVGQLSQVVSNLVINADQAMAGGGVLRISVENAEFSIPAHSLPPGRYIKLVVNDEGEGIPENIQDRVFDPYFTTKKSGNGLGLAMAHSIISRHCGQIEIASETGRGTTVTVYLPASDQKLDKVQKMGRSITSGVGRILIMDDEEFIRDVTADMLDLLGYDCVTCENGYQACDQYQQALDAGRPFAAVIMDLTIPGSMGGVEAMAAIRQFDPGARGIVSSGYSGDPVVASYGKFGFAAAIPKPFTLQQMADTLYGVLSPSAVSL